MTDKQIEMTISGMHCTACEANIRSALTTCPGVTHVEVTQGRACITRDDALCSMNDLLKALQSAGDFQMNGFRAL